MDHLWCITDSILGERVHINADIKGERRRTVTSAPGFIPGVYFDCQDTTVAWNEYRWTLTGSGLSLPSSEKHLLEGFPSPLSNGLVSSVSIGGAGGGYDQRIAVRTQMDCG